MSLSKEFSPAELANLSLWELPSVMDSRGTAPDSRAADCDLMPTLPTVEQIEAIQKTAFEEAARQGWQEGYQKGMEEGRTEGFEHGRREGFEQGRSDLDQRIQEFRDLADLLSGPLHELDAEVEEELLALCIAIARQLVRRELKTERDQIVAVIREAILALPASARAIRIAIHPEDADLVRSTLRVDEAKPRWELLEDPLLTRGGCRIETESSRIDATVENRLNQVISALLGGERKRDRR
ncbi:MAG: flagellar assembly protein FliH [Gammaproteobacteria bacterium]